MGFNHLKIENERRRKASDERIQVLLMDYYGGSYKSTKEFLARYNISSSVFNSYLKRNGLTSLQHTTRKYDVDTDYFKNIDNAEKAYWLGFIQCDGCLEDKPHRRCLELALSYIDIDHINKFKTAIHSNHIIREKLVANKYKYQ